MCRARVAEAPTYHEIEGHGVAVVCLVCFALVRGAVWCEGGRSARSLVGKREKKLIRQRQAFFSIFCCDGRV